MLTSHVSGLYIFVNICHLQFGMSTNSGWEGGILDLEMNQYPSKDW